MLITSLFLLAGTAATLDLDASLIDIRAGGEKRRGALASIVGAPDSNFDDLVKRLERPRQGTLAQYRRILDAIHGEYPDDKGVFRPPTRQKRELLQKRGEPDWMLLLDREAPTLLASQPSLAEPLAEAFEVIALLRGIAAAKRWDRYGSGPFPESARESNTAPGQTTSVSALISFAFSDFGTVFRDECGRQVRTLGNLAVPELVRYAFAQRSTTPRGKPAPWIGARQRYCLYQLDRLDRQNPARSVESAADELKADLLRAYGETRATPAIPVVLRELDAESQRVREIARWSWMQYVTVKPPPVPKRKRKLAGGRESRELQEVYLDYRTLAELELKRKWNDLVGEERVAEDKRGLRELTEDLFQRYDHRRARRVDEKMARAKASSDKGDLAAAAEVFGEILAEAPFHSRRSEIAPTFVALARELAQKEPERALGLLRQAEILAEGEAIAKTAQGLRAQMENAHKPRVVAPLFTVPPARRVTLGIGLAFLCVGAGWMWRRSREI